MSKDTMTTVIGCVLAAAAAAKEYVAVQSGLDTFGSWQFWVGMATATAVAVFGYWSKKDE